MQPAFFAELTNLCRHQILVLNDDKAIEEDDDTFDDTKEDSEVPLAVLLDRIHNPMQESNGYETDGNGRVISTTEAEYAFAEEGGEVSTEQAEEKKGEAGRKRLPTHCMQKIHSDGGRRTEYCIYMLSELVGMSMTGACGLNNCCAAGT